MADKKVDILHPLTSVDWVQCGELSHLKVEFKGPHIECVVLRDMVYMKYEGYTRAELHVASSSDLSNWTRLPSDLPTHSCALTTYHSQLVLVGGVDATGRVTNKLWTSDAGHDWQPSLPPMPTPRRNPFAINTVSPECLVVVSGFTLEVEMLIGKQWSTVQHPTWEKSLRGSILHNRRLYFNCVTAIHHCDVKKLIASSRTDQPRNTESLWSEIASPGFGRLTSFGQQLVVLSEFDVQAYSPITQSWMHVCKAVPGVRRVCDSVLLPTGDLLVCLKTSKIEVFQATLNVSSYPDSSLSMGSFSALEHAGIRIVTPLEEQLKELHRITEVPELDRWGQETSLMKLIERWGQGEGCLPLTWRSLLDTLQEISLGHLSRQIDGYLSEYLDAYRQILSTQECIEMWFFKVVLLGAPRLGKTTSCRRLAGEIDDIISSGEGEQPSTGTVESGHSVVIRNLSSTTALITPSEWLANKDLTDEARMILQYFHSHVREKKAMQSLATTQSMPTPKAAALSTPTTEATLSSTPTHKAKSRTEVRKRPKRARKGAKMKSQRISSVSTKPSTPPSRKSSWSTFDVPDMIRSAVSAKDWKDIKQLYKDTAFIRMEDTGGQPEFMDMLPALTIGPALYLLFCKLTDELQSSYKVFYLSPSSGESTTPVQSTYTVEEVFLTALSSIACLKSSSSTSLVSSEETTSSTIEQLLASCNKAVAYIVGTHKDLVSEKQIDEFDKKVQQCIRPTAFFKDDIVQFSSYPRMVLPVNNMSGGSSEVQWIRNILGECLKKHFKKLSIPASWFVLSLILRDRKERTANLESVLQLAGELGIPQREAMIALWFLHHYTGVLMHFPNLPELKDTVICDNQIVYDSATNLIVNTFKFPGQVSPAASERFRKTGQFSLEDIREATASVSGDYIPLKKLVTLLQHINSLASFKQSTSTAITSTSKVIYFMPCVLENATHKEMAKWWGVTSSQPSPAPLFIRYQCGFAPIGVFPAMIANLAANTSVELIWDGIKKNRVQFYYDYDTVTLVYHPKYYAVHIAPRPSAKTPTHEVCAAVRGLVESTLNTVTSQMNYDFSADYQLGFECPYHPGREHLCVVRQDRDKTPPHVMHCLGNTDNPRPAEMLSQHLIWFTECPPVKNQEASTILHGSSPSFDLCLSLLNLLKWKDEEGREQELRVVDEVSAKWYDFGMLLGLSLRQLDAWRDQHLADANKCWNRVINQWLTQGGSRDYPATWEGLYTLLRDTGFMNIARKLENAVIRRHSS